MHLHRRLRAGLAAFGLLGIALGGGALIGAAMAQDSGSSQEALALETVPATVPGAAARKQAAALMAPPSPRAQCISAEEYNRAALGSGCSCTCEEYARKPVSDTCDIACGGHPHCWMPRPTDEEVNAQFDKAMADQPAVIARSSASLTAQERDDLRASMGMIRALEWSEARKCQ